MGCTRWSWKGPYQSKPFYGSLQSDCPLLMAEWAENWVWYLPEIHQMSSVNCVPIYILMLIEEKSKRRVNKDV